MLFCWSVTVLNAVMISGLKFVRGCIRMRFTHVGFISLCLLSAMVLSCGGASDDASVDDVPLRAGGDTSVRNRTSFAFEDPSANLSEENLEKHLDGDIEFGNVFVTAPAPVNPGLGPLFNNVSCDSCHIKNGRGHPVFREGSLRSHALLMISDPEGEADVPGGNPPVEGLGSQIQDHSIFGVKREGTIVLSWKEIPGQYPDGTPYSLRKPVLHVILSDGSSLGEDIQTSMRLPLPLIGLGLLEAVSEETLLGLSDPDDSDGDGISGRPNMVWNQITASTEIGRFGRKANNPNLRMQTARAYTEDMGVSNPELPASDADTDITEEQLDLATFYVQTLAVPLRDGTSDADAAEGEALFSEIGCASCHVPVLKTGEHPIEEVSNQTIQPFTDLLLHDMGEGLADGRPDFEATGREWRTAPLWGVGLTGRILVTENFLHDGRARSLEEAILWHGGEAQGVTERFRSLPAQKRKNLIKFLNTL